MSDALPPDADEPLETMWEGRFIAARRRGRWEFVGRARNICAAVLIAIDEDAAGDHVILVEQYRVPLGRRTLELPAGLIGDETIDESTETAAARELEEETGYRAASLAVVGDFASSPGMVSETFTLLLARGLEKVGAGGGIDGEGITVHRVPLGDIAPYIAARRAEGLVMDVRLLLLLGAGLLAGRL